jgi:SAM-dependent methyltransferase
MESVRPLPESEAASAPGTSNERAKGRSSWRPPIAGRVRWAWLLDLPWRRRRARQLLRMLEGGRTTSEGVLLDVGGGTGTGIRATLRVAPRTAYRSRVVVDPQREMLLRARAKTATPDAVELVLGTGARLPVASESVDTVLSLGVLCCMPPEKIRDAVEETWRVLRSGGCAVVAVPRWWGDVAHPWFEAQGFRRVSHPRPGWSLYERPRAGDYRPEAALTAG